MRAIVAVWLLSVVTCAGIVGYGWMTRKGVNVDRADAPFYRLQADADIDYCLPIPLGPNTYFEFDTSPAGYQEWVVNWSKQVELIGPQPAPFQMHRYNHVRQDVDVITIEDGVLYSKTEEDRGNYLGYDNVTGRAYYFGHSR